VATFFGTPSGTHKTVEDHSTWREKTRKEELKNTVTDEPSPKEDFSWRRRRRCIDQIAPASQENLQEVAVGMRDIFLKSIANLSLGPTNSIVGPLQAIT
jgi:hypothetical protein